ncbi:MAG: hypothetical protein ACE5FV_12360 [Woeseia sp.]
MTRTTIRICIWGALTCGFIFLPACGDSESPTEPAADSTATAPATRADGYAPMLTMPETLPDDPGVQMMVMMANNSEVPSASEVNVPAYPDAAVMSTMGPMEMTANDEKITSLPSMAMLSADEVSDVVAFYKERLADWQYKEFVGTHSFWNGGEDSNPLDITGQFSLVVVVPLSETDSARAVWPDMRSRIDLRYQPGAP